MIVLDAPVAQYVVIVVHDQYEQSTFFFVGEQAALDKYQEWAHNNNEVHLAKVIK